MSLIFDFETQSIIDLKLRGAYVYAQHPSTDALLASFKLRQVDEFKASWATTVWISAGGPLNTVCRWRRGEPCPPYVRAYIEAGGEIEAHNAAFERLIWWNIMVPRHGWPRPRLEQFRCSMATGRALGYPANLAKLGETLDLKIKKDKRGDGLIKIHSCPVKFTTGGAPIWHPLANDPASLAAFHDYCDTDVLSEEESSSRMIPLSDAEMEIYHLSEEINDRGVRIDITSVRAAIELADKAKIELDKRMAAATAGAVTAASQVARLTAWLISRGVALDGVAKNNVLEALDLDDLSDDCREALLIRQEAAKPSTSKLKAFLKHVSADGRVRGMFIFYGTGPGRWASAGGVNLANLPRPRPIYDDADLDAATLFKAIRSTEPALLQDLYGAELGKPLHLISDALRGFLWAAPGHEFIAVDYSGIQGAIGAWLAKEEWKLTAMREIIADPKLPDLYRRAAAGILNTTVEIITKKHWGRQIGKVAELALLFAGGVTALVEMAANYGMRRAALHSLYPGVWSAASKEAREKAVKRWEKAMKSRQRQHSDVLTREAWIACSLIVHGWRANNPASVEAWSELETRMRNAVSNPGVKFPVCGRMTYLCTQGFLWLRLPSGRPVAYAQPRLKDQVWAKLKLLDGSWGESEVVDRDEAEKLEIRGLAKIEGKTSPKVTALGWDSTKNKMLRYALYGGLAMQNCLAAGTQVLTPSGWKSIEDLTTVDYVWDGEAWVSHKGLIAKGEQTTVELGGVWLTPEHGVWTRNGWSAAEHVDLHEAQAASQVPGESRAAVRTPGSHFVCGRRREEELLADKMRLRSDVAEGRIGDGAGSRHELWVLPHGTNENALGHAWDVQAPSIPRMGEHARSLSPANAPGMAQLRSEGNISLSRMADVQTVLEGYGSDLQNRFDIGKNQQQRRIFAKELRMADPQAAGSKQTNQRIREHTGGSNAFVRSVRKILNFATRLLLACSSWLAGMGLVRSAWVARERRILVYDLLDAGPKHRFTVRCSNGKTMIVSNCCLGTESDILRRAMRNCKAAGYPIVMHNYDEAVAELPIGAGSVEEMERLMLDLEPWTEGLPLTAHGWRGKRYRK